MRIKIDEKGEAVYLQIAKFYNEQINSGELRDGDKLPSERSLANELGVSRGTITKVYDHLEQEQLVVRIKGKGCFVTRDTSYLSLDRKEKAIKLIRDMIRGMTDMGFSLSETRIFTEIVLMEQEKKYKTIRIGIIDCNQEALYAIKAQIGNLKDIRIRLYELSEIESNQTQSDILSNDLLITTYTHYEEIVERIHDVSDRLIRVSMSPSKKTFIQIGRIRKGASIGILHNTDRFLGVIQRALQVGEIPQDEEEAMNLNESKESIAAFIKHKEVIIIPPLNYFESSYCKWIMNHLSNKIYIEFEYLIERGNLLYLEEKIRHLMIMK